MAANEILPFGTAGTNELTQANYAADAQRASGNQPGFARSELVNKVLHQTSVISAGVAQFIADRQGAGVTDQLLPSQVAAMLAAAFSNGAVLGNPGNIALPGGWIIKVGTVGYSDIDPPATTNRLQITVNHPAAFPSVCIAALVSLQTTQNATARTLSSDRFGLTAELYEFEEVTVGGVLNYIAIGY